MKKKTIKRVALAAFSSLSRCGVDGRKADAISGAILAALLEYDRNEKRTQKTPKEAVNG